MFRNFSRFSVTLLPFLAGILLAVAGAWAINLIGNPVASDDAAANRGEVRAPLRLPFGPTERVYEKHCPICGGQMTVHGSFCTPEDKTCYEVVRCSECGALFLPTFSLVGKTVGTDTGQMAIIDDDGNELVIGEESANLYLEAQGRIGAGLSAREDGSIFVALVHPGLLAEASGLLEGDTIRAVDGVSTSGKSLAEVQELLRVWPGESKTVRLERGNETMNVVLKRPVDAGS